MGVINKANVPPPVLPKQVVDVPELGGEVIVRGLLLNDRIEVIEKASEGELNIAEMLARTVVDDENTPIYTAQQWDEFGSTNFGCALNLFNIAKGLCGFKADINEKK